MPALLFRFPLLRQPLGLGDLGRGHFGRDLVALTRHMPQLARARVRLESHLGHIIDGGDVPARLEKGDVITKMFVRE